mgnify:CR=1 FL=1
MNIDRCWAVIKSEIYNVNEQRFDDFDLILRCLMIISDDIVDEYKQSRDFHKRKDSKFKFWTYVPSIERGSLSVVIRWRRYSGHGRYSDPVATSQLVDYRIPMSFFPKCTRPEKSAIMHAETQFSTVRKIGEKLLLIAQAQNALLDITGARCQKEDQRVTGRLQRVQQKAEEDDLVHNSATDTIEFTDAERAAFRKKHGLGPRRYS